LELNFLPKVAKHSEQILSCSIRIWMFSSFSFSYSIKSLICWFDYCIHAILHNFILLLSTLFMAITAWLRGENVMLNTRIRGQKLNYSKTLTITFLIIIYRNWAFATTTSGCKDIGGGIRVCDKKAVPLYLKHCKLKKRN